MNELEMQLDYPLGETLPEPGTTIEVAPGVRWLRMTLPFALNHINLWLLRDRIDGREGWSIVDCGIDDPRTRADWEGVFATALDGLPVLRVIVTHMHPDHIGLAHWLCERWDCRLWISGTDYLAARMAGQPLGLARGDHAAAFAADHGVSDPAALEVIRGRGAHYGRMVPALPDAFRRLHDGGSVAIGGREWVPHVGHGHTPEHMSLHCAELGVLISGDMVLPRISTNISVGALEPESNALREYLDSLERTRSLPADTLVLPSHGKPFRGLHTRIDQLLAHHADRLADVLAACREAPRAAGELLFVLFQRELDLHQTGFAIGEAVAHLHVLWLTGALERRRDDDGVLRFSATA